MATPSAATQHSAKYDPAAMESPICGETRRPGGGGTHGRDGCWIPQEDFPQAHDAHHGEASTADNQHPQRALEERGVQLAQRGHDHVERESFEHDGR